jgi:hypothetical protein
MNQSNSFSQTAVRLAYVEFLRIGDVANEGRTQFSSRVPTYQGYAGTHARDAAAERHIPGFLCELLSSFAVVWLFFALAC